MRPLPVNDWEPSLQHVVSDMKGRPLNVHALLANHPRLLDAWWTLRNYLVQGGDLDQRQCELVILRIAAHKRSWYEWACHVVRGLDSGLSLEEIDRVRRDDASWQEMDMVLLHAVDEILSAGCLSPATLERLSRHFTDRQVLDLVHLHGMYATLACVISTWSIDLDEHVSQHLPATVTPEGFGT